MIQAAPSSMWLSKPSLQRPLSLQQTSSTRKDSWEKMATSCCGSGQLTDLASHNVQDQPPRITQRPYWLIHLDTYWVNKLIHILKKMVFLISIYVLIHIDTLIPSKYDYLMLPWWLEMCWRPTWSAESRISPPTRRSAGRLSAFTLQNIAQKRPKISPLIGYNDTTQ